MLLAICGGYQILGRTWVLGDEEVAGLDIVDAVTKRADGGSHNRLVSNIALSSPLATIPVIGFTAAFLLVLRALISTAHAHRSGLALFSDCCELTGAKGLSAHTLRVFRGSTALIRIRQNPLARTLGYCTLRIYPYGSKRGALSSIKLPFRRTLAVCERLM